jgi:hypothetical protein
MYTSNNKGAHMNERKINEWVGSLKSNFTMHGANNEGEKRGKKGKIMNYHFQLFSLCLSFSHTLTVFVVKWLRILPAL